VVRYPKASYTGLLANFKNGAPTAVHGQLTLHGITQPLDLAIRSFKCMVNPMNKKEVCGANAFGLLNRAEYGIVR